MQVILIISLFLAAVSAIPFGLSITSELNDEWEIYKTLYKKQYEYLEEVARRIIWEQNLRHIQQHNIEYDLGKHTYTLGLNEFADMTHEEFQKKYLGITQTLKSSTGSNFIAPENIGDLPTTVDWRTKRCVTRVKDQASCGSCWAFSATGSLEGQYCRETGNLTSLSEQQLIDCSGSFGNNGCGGGLMDNAFEYVKKYGIESEETYPYKAQDGKCHYDKSKIVTKCTGFVNIKSGSETDLAVAVATAGPISVAIDANHPSFHLYKSGVYNEPKCSSTQLDHGVLAVGYGIDSGKKYWLVKNSWGLSWGMAGYIEMSKDANNQCGIATMASYPLV